MHKHMLITMLFGNTDEAVKVTAVQKLEAFLSDTDVVLALCIASLQTDSHQLRTAVIKILKSIEDKVNPYFAHVAIKASSASLRKWALVNLSLMECKNAKAAVMSGLKDSSRLVQQAAVLNIGLYRDADFLKDVEIYFERSSSNAFFLNSTESDHPVTNNGSLENKQK